MVESKGVEKDIHLNNKHITSAMALLLLDKEASRQRKGKWK